MTLRVWLLSAPDCRRIVAGLGRESICNALGCTKTHLASYGEEVRFGPLRELALSQPGIVFVSHRVSDDPDHFWPEASRVRAYSHSVEAR